MKEMELKKKLKSIMDTQKEHEENQERRQMLVHPRIEEELPRLNEREFMKADYTQQLLHGVRLTDNFRLIKDMPLAMVMPLVIHTRPRRPGEKKAEKKRRKAANQAEWALKDQLEKIERREMECRIWTLEHKQEGAWGKRKTELEKKLLLEKHKYIELETRARIKKREYDKGESRLLKEYDELGERGIAAGRGILAESIIMDELEKNQKLLKLYSDFRMKEGISQPAMAFAQRGEQKYIAAAKKKLLELRELERKTPMKKTGAVLDERKEDLLNQVGQTHQVNLFNRGKKSDRRVLDALSSHRKQMTESDLPKYASLFETAFSGTQGKELRYANPETICRKDSLDEKEEKEYKMAYYCFWENCRTLLDLKPADLEPENIVLNADKMDKMRTLGLYFDKVWEVLPEGRRVKNEGKTVFPCSVMGEYGRQIKVLGEYFDKVLSMAGIMGDNVKGYYMMPGYLLKLRERVADKQEAALTALKELGNTDVGVLKSFLEDRHMKIVKDASDKPDVFL